MNRSKIQTGLTFLLLLAAIASAAEPNKPEANLIFELKTGGYSLPIGNPADAPYIGSLIVKMNALPRWTLDKIMTAPAGKTLSDEQKKLMFNTDCVQESLLNRESHQGMVWLFGVSEEEIKKLTQAVVEAADVRAQKTKELLLAEQTKLKESIAANEDRIPKMEKDLKKFSSDSNVNLPEFMDTNMAMSMENSVFETNKVLDMIDIEMAGLGAKLKEIDFQRNLQNEKIRRGGANQASAENILANLDKMQVEITIELRGVEAKKKAKEEIMQREKNKISAFREKVQLEKGLKHARGELQNDKLNLESIEGRLKTPSPGEGPLEVFQNKVTIYTTKQAD